jgi:hypothetical protein
MSSKIHVVIDSCVETRIRNMSETDAIGSNQCSYVFKFVVGELMHFV